MTKSAADQEFVEFIVKSIVNSPDDVETNRTVDEMGVLITLKVNPEDMGGVIGKGGATARALRTLLRVVGAKNNARVNLKIEEPEGGRVERPAMPATPAVSAVPATPEAPISEEARKAQSVDDVVEELKL